MSSNHFAADENYLEKLLHNKTGTILQEQQGYTIIAKMISLVME